MDRLVAFGCSMTYGHGLSDCFTPPDGYGPKPSSQSWPSILASMLDLYCINAGHPGASNLRILDTIINFDFKSSDTVFVLWTHKHRDMLYTKKDPADIGPWDTPVFKKWIKLHTYDDIEYRAWLHIHHAWQILTNKKVKFHFLSTHQGETPPLWCKDVFFLDSDIVKMMKKNPLALDNIHPGKDCHYKYAESIKAEISV